MTLFITGVFLGALASFASLYFTVLRREADEPEEWAENYAHLEREFQTLRNQLPPPAPRAVTRLTNRQRTIEL